MRRILIYCLATIGLISVLKLGYDFIKYQNDAAEYLKKCREVKVGITLEEAKKIMGDYAYYDRKNRSEIWTYFSNEPVKTYYLTYPAPFTASTGTEIYFDPITQIVTKIVCGE